LKIRITKENKERRTSYVRRFLLPVCLAAIIPTFCPGGAFLETVVGFKEFDMWEPPPCGWNAAFIAIPLDFG
jgi:hypothetical protein